MSHFLTLWSNEEHCLLGTMHSDGELPSQGLPENEQPLVSSKFVGSSQKKSLFRILERGGQPASYINTTVAMSFRFFKDLEYSGLRLIMPRIIQPAAYYSHLGLVRIFMKLNKNFGYYSQLLITAT